MPDKTRQIPDLTLVRIGRTHADLEEGASDTGRFMIGRFRGIHTESIAKKLLIDRHDDAG